MSDEREEINRIRNAVPTPALHFSVDGQPDHQTITIFEGSPGAWTVRGFRWPADAVKVHVPASSFSTWEDAKAAVEKWGKLTLVRQTLD